MTTTLRKIAEDLAYISDQPARRYIAFLLKTVVEERTELIARTDENIEITLKQAKKKALRELDLEGIEWRK